MGTQPLSDIANWAHRWPNLLKAGRCSHLAPEGLDEEAREAALAALAEDDRVEERFRALGGEDYVPLKGLEVSWLTKVCGDTQVYESKEEGAAASCYAVNVIRSLRWPGAITCAKAGKYCCIYVGDGMKRGDTSFNPTEPPEVQMDPLDQIERQEPTPLLPPEEPAEPDTDAEKVDPEAEEDN